MRALLVAAVAGAIAGLVWWLTPAFGAGLDRNPVWGELMMDIDVAGILIQELTLGFWESRILWIPIVLAVVAVEIVRRELKGPPPPRPPRHRPRYRRPRRPKKPPFRW